MIIDPFFDDLKAGKVDMTKLIKEINRTYDNRCFGKTELMTALITEYLKEKVEKN